MGKNNWLLQHLKFRSCLSKTGNEKDLSHSVGTGWGGGHRPLSGAAGFGGGTIAGTCFLALLCARDSENRDCFGGRENSGSTMVAVTMPQPTYRNSKSDSPSLSKPSDRYLSQLKPFPNLPSCGRRNGWLLSSAFSRGQNSVLCILLTGTAHISIRRGLGLTCTFSLCVAGITASKLESHQPSWQSSSKLLLLLGSYPLPLLKSMDKLHPGGLASSTDDALNV